MELSNILAGGGLLVGLVGVVIALVLHSSARQREKRLQTQLEKIAHELQENKEAKEKLKKKLPVEIVSNIVFDGMKGCGKSTFLAKVLNPAFTGKPEMTTRYSPLPPHPICWNTSAEEKTEIFALRAHDVSGENPGTLIDALQEIKGRYPSEPCVLLIIWDAQEKEQNKIHLNEHRLKMGYNNELAKGLFKHVFVFVNKTDTLSGRQEIEAATKEAEEYLKGTIGDYLGAPQVFSGSTETGEGVHRCCGKIFEALGWSRHFPVMRGQTTT